MRSFVQAEVILVPLAQAVATAASVVIIAPLLTELVLGQVESALEVAFASDLAMTAPETESPTNNQRRSIQGRCRRLLAHFEKCGTYPIQPAPSEWWHQRRSQRNLSTKHHHQSLHLSWLVRVFVECKTNVLEFFQIANKHSCQQHSR